MIFLELNPPSEPDLSKLIQKVRELNSFNAFIITELSMRKRSDAWMDTMYTSIRLREATGKRVIPVMTSRENTVRGVISRALMAIHGGIEELVIVRGDDSPFGGAFGMSVEEMVREVRSIYARFSRDVRIYVAANPTADIEAEIRRAVEKLSAGADAVITQPTMDFDLLRNFVVGLRKLGFANPIVGSVMIIESPDSADRMEMRCGIKFPGWFKEELARGNWRRALMKAVREVARICDGVHISPIARFSFSEELAEEARRIISSEPKAQFWESKIISKRVSSEEC